MRPRAGWRPAVESATFEDTVYAIPLNTNTQLLWYRTDLTEEPPATWDELLDAADELEADGEPHRSGRRRSATRGWSCGSPRSWPRPAARS